MTKFNYGFGHEVKKVNPLKVLGIIVLVLIGIGIFIYARDYDRYYTHFKEFNHEPIVQKTDGEETEQTDEENNEEESEEDSEGQE